MRGLTWRLIDVAARKAGRDRFAWGLRRRARRGPCGS